MTDWKKEFRKRFYLPNPLDGWSIQAKIGDLETFIDQLLSEQREEIWEDVQPLITVWGGDTARSVGTRVGNYFIKPARSQQPVEEYWCGMCRVWSDKAHPGHIGPDIRRSKQSEAQQPEECNHDTTYCQEHNQIKGKFTFPQEPSEKKQAPHWMDCNCECHGFGATDEAESCPHCQPERYPDYDTPPQGAALEEDQ